MGIPGRDAGNRCQWPEMYPDSPLPCWGEVGCCELYPGIYVYGCKGHMPMLDGDEYEPPPVTAQH